MQPGTDVGCHGDRGVGPFRQLIRHPPNPICAVTISSECICKRSHPHNPRRNGNLQRPRSRPIPCKSASSYSRTAAPRTSPLPLRLVSGIPPLFPTQAQHFLPGPDTAATRAAIANEEGVAHAISRYSRSALTKPTNWATTVQYRSARPQTTSTIGDGRRGNRSARGWRSKTR